jgi:phosphoglycolate phosphatase-like HAD superfamily hydrolase
VGDSIHDLQAAREAGVAFIGVEGGVHTRLDLEAAGCSTVIREPLELLHYLELTTA